VASGDLIMIHIMEVIPMVTMAHHLAMVDMVAMEVVDMVVVSGV